VLSADEARWIAIEAQGLGRDRPRTQATRHRLLKVLAALGTLQLDAVNVLERAQFLVLFARLGPFEVTTFHDMNGPGGDLFEYWGHAASLLPMTDQPLLRWRMAGLHPYGGGDRYTARRIAWSKDHKDYIKAVLSEVRERGALAARELEDPRRQDGEWWGRRSLGRQALEWLFLKGDVVGWRRPNFERVYDLPERVIPADILAAPTLTREEAQRRLLLISARALGVGTGADLADYFRIKLNDARLRIRELVDAGALSLARVQGWPEDAFVLPGLRLRRPTRADAALLTPFDSLIWERARTRRLFDFDYQTEIYTPELKRKFGYYVLPMLLGDRLVGRFDLKADRSASSLLVRAAHAEPEVNKVHVARAAFDELQRLREWLRLDRTVIEQRGDLAQALRRESRAQRGEG
jgi:uncharacterized protein YcaQ